MQIRETLKKHEITLTRFAKKINVSRPTLDSYISIYESGKEIGNEKMQIGFEWLFKDNNVSTPEFYKILNDFSRMLKREELLGMTDLPVDDSDILMELFITMIDDFKTNDYNSDIYNFIQLIVNGYKKEEIIKDLTNYFLIINLMKELNSLEINQQCKIAIYYDFFNQFMHNNDFSAKKSELNKLIKIIESIKKEREKEENNIKSQFEDILKEKLIEEKKKGRDISNLSVAEVLELLKEH